MALKTSTGRLYMLFNACLPQNKQVEKRLLVDKISESLDYNEIASYEPLSSFFKENLAQDVLVTYDNKKLQETEKVIPEIIPLAKKLTKAIKYGNGWDLKPEDKPDLMSLESINILADKLIENSGDENITNITEKECFQIFDKNTEKTAQNVVTQVTVGELDNIREVLGKTISNKYYCINANDVDGVKNNFQQKIAKIKEETFTLKRKKTWRKLAKLAAVAIGLLIMGFLISTLGLIYGSGASIAVSVSAILMIIYLIIG